MLLVVGLLSTRWGLRIDQNPNELGAAAVEYLRYFGYIMYAYMWLRMSVVAEQKLAEDDGFHQSKLDSCRFYLERIFPRVSALKLAISAGSASIKVETDWL